MCGRETGVVGGVVSIALLLINGLNQTESALLISLVHYLKDLTHHITKTLLRLIEHQQSNEPKQKDSWTIRKNGGT